jgi:hypothetical protein
MGDEIHAARELASTNVSASRAMTAAATPALGVIVDGNC